MFAPLADVGLMILDEEQESSYQSESMVRYHAREVAKFRCAHHKGLLLLGSATPAVESRYAAEMGQYHLFTLRQRYNAHQMPKVRLVDMKQELRQGNATACPACCGKSWRKTSGGGNRAFSFSTAGATAVWWYAASAARFPPVPGARFI